MRRRKSRKPMKLKKALPEYRNSEMQRRIDELIHSKADRELMQLKLLDGYTFSQVSVLQDRPLSTVRDRYYSLLPTLFGDNP